MASSSLVVPMRPPTGALRACGRARSTKRPIHSPIPPVLHSTRAQASGKGEPTMATVMVMNWPGVTREHYEALRRETNFEGDAPRGGKYHVAWSSAEGMH